MTLWSLGKLAQKGCFRDVVSWVELKPLFERLNQIKNAESRHIGESFWMLGKLAEKGRLEGEVYWIELKPLFGKLCEVRTPIAQDIGEFFWSLGKLAQQGCFEGVVSWVELKPFFEKLYWISHSDSQAMGESLWALGKLAQKGCFEGTVSWFDLKPLFGKLGEIKNAESQHVSESIWALGILIKKGCFKERVPWFELEPLFEALHQIQPFDSAAAGKSIWALGKLAEHGQLEGEVSWRTVSRLLEKLNKTRRLESRDIVQVLDGLGMLAQHNKVQDISLDTSIVLIKQLDRYTHAPLYKWAPADISISLRGFSQLLHVAREIPNSFSIPTIALLVRRLLQSRLNAMHVSTALLAICGIEARTRKLWDNVKNEVISLVSQLQGKAVSKTIFKEVLVALQQLSEAQRNTLFAEKKARVSLESTRNYLVSLGEIEENDPQFSLAGLFSSASPLLLREQDFESPPREDELLWEPQEGDAFEDLPLVSYGLPTPYFDLSDFSGFSKLLRHFKQQEISYLSDSFEQKDQRPPIVIAPVAAIGGELGAYAGKPNPFE